MLVSPQFVLNTNFAAYPPNILCGDSAYSATAPWYMPAGFQGALAGPAFCAVPAVPATSYDFEALAKTSVTDVEGHALEKADAESISPSKVGVQSGADSTPSTAIPTHDSTPLGNSKSGRKKRGKKVATAVCPKAIADGGDAIDLGQDKERCEKIILDLERGGCNVTSILVWILPATKALAFSKHGCRVLQKAIEVTGGESRGSLVEKLKEKDTVLKLYQDPHGNHVLGKMIEVMPPANLDFLIRAFEGKAKDVARHQYGCRLLERLIEHCPAAQVETLVMEMLKDDEGEKLCRHPYGNFVIQHIFEHGQSAWKAMIVEQIIKTLPTLAKHRTASHVVQKALQHSGEEMQQSLVLALVHAQGDDSFVEVACSRYGSFVVEEMTSIQAYGDLARAKLQASRAHLGESQYGKKLVDKLGVLKTTATA